MHDAKLGTLEYTRKRLDNVLLLCPTIEASKAKTMRFTPMVTIKHSYETLYWKLNSTFRLFGPSVNG